MNRKIVFFIGKLIAYFVLISVERVLGFPILSSYFIWNDTYPLNFIYTIVFIFISSIVLSTLFGLNSLILFVVYSLVKQFYSSSIIRKNKLAGIAASVFIVVVLFWSSVDGFSWRLGVYSTLQILLLAISQLKLTHAKGVVISKNYVS